MNRIFISCGDVNGIGIEILERSIEPFLESTQFILSLPESLTYHFPASVILNTNEIPNNNGFFIAPLKTISSFKRTPGKLDKDSGIIAHDSFLYCIDKIKDDRSAGLVTLPIHKKSFTDAGSPFTGHTEYLGHLLGESSPLMILMNSHMKVALLTVHKPLSEVSKSISADLIKKTVSQFHSSLTTDFGIEQPRIALLGLNPHAGDDGVIGTEEIQYYLPAVQEMKQKGYSVEGPFSADGFFGSKLFKNFDGIIASYHDQGLIPVKLSDMSHGINFSAGSSIVRTSPDHGTAFDIAGKGIAEPDSLKEAIYWNIKIRQYRKLI